MLRFSVLVPLFLGALSVTVWFNVGVADVVPAVEDWIGPAAFTQDDACDNAEDDCALSVLQKRVLTENDMDSSDRRRPSQAKDLSVAWYKKLWAWAVFLDKNITLMEWKMHYFNEDLSYYNNSLFGVHSEKKYVNGTRVNWNKHPSTWIPTFSLLGTSTEVSSVARDGEADEDRSTSGSHRRRGGGMRHVPPRKRKMQEIMTKEQDRLSGAWHDITILKRRMDWIGNYMGSHRRLYHKRPVLVQEHESRMHKETVRILWDGDAEWATGPEPQEELVKQVKSMVNQTGTLWVEFHKVGRLVEASKHRMKRWKKGKPVN